MVEFKSFVFLGSSAEHIRTPYFRVGPEISKVTPGHKTQCYLFQIY